MHSTPPDIQEESRYIRCISRSSGTKKVSVNSICRYFRGRYTQSIMCRRELRPMRLVGWYTEVHCTCILGPLLCLAVRARTQHYTGSYGYSNNERTEGQGKRAHILGRLVQHGKHAKQPMSQARMRLAHVYVYSIYRNRSPKKECSLGQNYNKCNEAV